ncbi:sulfatase family protein [Puniceicoccus vermicola]|uniref:Sulfatase-like hydrolase/transferase n=1 Tax=Puniceicoccus vermicola TaxID=388746 RepID=A0A7X1AY72_9BACT|nr:sulfatase-like hydrolase/transferase [Puniceicoccus vermicola]MBC2602142.1 sulfatase-like hydrolase/transferase [Puniceicoccus vermicola]
MSSSRRPNILHLFTDQQRFDTIAALGHYPFLKTPNLDRLTSEGTTFERAYSPSPECVPARACMITGQYPGRTGCFSNANRMPAEDQPTFMERLRQSGYRTHGVGKCHFTPDPYSKRGFETRDYQEEIPEDRVRDDYARDLVESDCGWVLEPHGIRGEMYYVPQPSLLPEEKHPTHWIGDRSIDFIESEKTESQPWYLYSSFIHPHPPFAPPVPWHKLYRGPDMPLPDLPGDLEELTFFINRRQNRQKYRDYGGLDLNLIRQMRAYYFACISFIDKQVGRILQSLEKTGQLENTLIVFSADHGEYLGDYGCFGKRGMHDVSARVPMIVRWPDGSRADTRTGTPVSLIDLAPTFLRAADVPFETEDFDGIPLQSVADGSTGRTQVFSQYNCQENGLYMAVEEGWKYIFSAPDQKEYLFDLTNDPRENHNLASTTESHPELLRLREACQNWVHTTGQPGALAPDGTWHEYPIQKVPQDPNAMLGFQDPRWWDGKLPEW